MSSFQGSFAFSRMRNLGIEFPFAIAPMVALSHVAFRKLIASYTPTNVNALRFTEMLSTRRIPNERLETTNELKIGEGETYFVPQLLGNEEKFIAPSIEKLIQKKPWGFDINMGCPVSHTLKHNWGVRLMGDKEYAANVVKIVKKYSPVPVSVKLRGGAGDKNEDINCLYSFVDALQDAGADFLTIHARTRAQKHSGEADWQLVANVKKRLSIPILANGNIQTADDALSILNDFECDGAMIARAAVARPWILWQVSHKLGNHVTPFGREGCNPPFTSDEEGAEYGRACLKFLQILCECFQDEQYILEKFRFFVATGSRWFQFGHHFWRLTMRARSAQELHEIVGEFYSKHENPMTNKIKML